MSYVLAEREEPVMIFTGDALFVGDVGRTDLYSPEDASSLAETLYDPGFIFQISERYFLEETLRLSGALYDSIFNKILPLGDGVILCPAHGAGSVCGGNISDRDESTIGIERTQNPVLQLINRDDFIEHKVSEHHERPPYFRQMEKYNLEGPPLLGRLPKPPPLTPVECKEEMEREAVVVDARTPPAFGGAHIKGALHAYVGQLESRLSEIPRDRPITIVCNVGHRASLAASILLRAGYPNVCCDVLGSTTAWRASKFPMTKE